MLSVQSLLNPVKPEPRGTLLPSSPPSSHYTFSPTPRSNPHPSLSHPSQHQQLTKKAKMTKDGAVFAKGKIKGEVNFPPFEHLDEDILRELQKFQIYPLGNIKEYARHIPYNSEKKTFLEKTGRESFEVFQYVFRVPGDDKDYVVMWDYNIGLVRITPFFKCCKYSKTTPAKMLNMNPGLKEITHSITGGALAAQGYWMPYSCALAVCTTFCSHIAYALIPIFGPSFPSLCVSPEAPEHGRMIIPGSVVQASTAEAEQFRLQYTSSQNQHHNQHHNHNHHQTYPSAPQSSSGASVISAREAYSSSPMLSIASDRMSVDRRTPPNSHPNSINTSNSANANSTFPTRLRTNLKRTFGAGGNESPYGLQTHTPTNNESDFETCATASESSGDGYFLSPVTPGSTHSIPHSHSHSSIPQGHPHSHSQGKGQGQAGNQNQWHALNHTAHALNASIAISPGAGAHTHSIHPTHSHQTYTHSSTRPSTHAHAQHNYSTLPSRHPQTHRAHAAHPLLSAIPRSTGLGVDIAMSGVGIGVGVGGGVGIGTNSGTSTWRTANKRRVEEVDADDEYESSHSHSPVSVGASGSASASAGSSGSGSGSSRSGSGKRGSGASGRKGAGKGKGKEGEGGEEAGAEKKAALLLMKLSVKDGESGVPAGISEGHGFMEGVGGNEMGGSGMGGFGGLGYGVAVGGAVGGEGPRIKRRRATSM